MVWEMGLGHVDVKMLKGEARGLDLECTFFNLAQNIVLHEYRQSRIQTQSLQAYRVVTGYSR